MPLDNRSAVVLFYESLACGRLDTVQELLDPNVEYRAAVNFIYADKNPYAGPAAVLALLRRMAAEWEHFEMITDEIHGASDLVIACGRYLGTYKTNGYNLLAEFVHVFKFKDGKIVSQHNYTDTAQFRDAVNKEPGVNLPAGA